MQYIGVWTRTCKCSVRGTISGLMSSTAAKACAQVKFSVEASHVRGLCCYLSVTLFSLHSPQALRICARIANVLFTRRAHLPIYVSGAFAKGAPNLYSVVPCVSSRTRNWQLNLRMCPAVAVVAAVVLVSLCG